ncbi:hypothetical protein [Streptomyces sp. NPDC055607]
MMEENREVNVDWIPISGFQLRKAGVQFDAVRVGGEGRRRLADRFVHPLLLRSAVAELFACRNDR